MTEEKRAWTIAYREAGQPVFTRKDLHLTWQEAFDAAQEYGTEHPGHDVWYITTRDAELTEYVCREDVMNILLDDGTRVPIVEEKASGDNA